MEANVKRRVPLAVLTPVSLSESVQKEAAAGK